MKKHMILIAIAALFLFGCARPEAAFVSNEVPSEPQAEVQEIQEATSSSSIYQMVIKKLRESDQVFTIEKTDLTLRKGKNGTMYAAVRNKNDVPLAVTASGVCANNMLTIPKQRFTVDAGESFVFEYLFNSSMLPVLKNMPCDLSVYSEDYPPSIGGRKSIYIRII